MDFVADQLADGTRFRSLTVVDIYSRECVTIESEQRLKGEDVVLVLNRIMW
jgi:putative transposase